jgi:hypothetical protein
VRTELPGRFGGRSVRYVSLPSASHARERLLTPGVLHEDNTDYRVLGLMPGIKVCGESMMTSAGVIVEYQDGRKRVTLANHGFYDGTDVYHPDSLPSFYFGSIIERYMFNDVACCDLNPNTTFSNKTYFAAQTPTKLVDAYSMERSIDSEAWFEVEGMSTGRVFLLYSGPGSKLRNLSNELTDSHVIDHQIAFDWFGPNNVVRGGICGAPIVYENAPGHDMDGAVVGFYFWDDGKHAIVPTLDRFIDAGWKLCNQ